jgi:hypothetical protein
MWAFCEYGETLATAQDAFGRLVSDWHMIPYRRMMHNGEPAPFGVMCYNNFHLISSSHFFNRQALKLCLVVCHILEISPYQSLPLLSEFSSHCRYPSYSAARSKRSLAHPYFRRVWESMPSPNRQWNFCHKRTALQSTKPYPLLALKVCDDSI